MANPEWTDPLDWEDGLSADDEEDEFDCHMMHDGSCGAAGSEDCEFECPYRRERRFRARRPRPLPLFDATTTETGR